MVGGERRRGGGGRLFEAGRLLTSSAFGKGAYSRWALIRGWALFRASDVVRRGSPVGFSENGICVI